MGTFLTYPGPPLCDNLPHKITIILYLYNLKCEIHESENTFKSPKGTRHLGKEDKTFSLKRHYTLKTVFKAKSDTLKTPLKVRRII